MTQATIPTPDSSIDPTIFLFYSENLYGEGKAPLIGHFPMHFWKSRDPGPRPDILGSPVQTGILIALLIPYDNTRLQVSFKPGSTGHENYLFDSDFVSLVNERPLHVPLDEGEIRMPWTKDGTKSAEWVLCAGSPAYDRLKVTMVAMKAMVQYFTPLAQAWHAQRALDSDLAVP